MRNKNLRVDNTCYQTSPQTLRWTQQSLSLRRKLTSKAFLSKIQTPILMLCGERESVVNPQAQVEFVQNCPACRQVILPGLTHNMLWGPEQTVAAVMQEILDHFA